MICPKCGKENHETNKFCKYCGTPLPRKQNGETEETESKTKKAFVFFGVMFGVMLILLLGAGLAHSSQRATVSQRNGSGSGLSNEMIRTPDDTASSPMPAEKTEEEWFSEVASTFKHFYLSYLNASNERNADWIDHCTEELREKQKKRIFQNNASYTFSNKAIWLDMDSYQMTVYGNDGYASFKVSIENDGWHRQTGEYVFNNPAMQIEMVCEDGEWIVYDVNTIDRAYLGQNYREITYY